MWSYGCIMVVVLCFHLRYTMREDVDFFPSTFSQYFSRDDGLNRKTTLVNKAPTLKVPASASKSHNLKVYAIAAD